MCSSKIILEICIDSVAGALSATLGGADRLELCSALSEGGITPSYGLVEQVRKASELPVMMMIRCRGGSFVYTEQEIDVMLADIVVAKSLGVHGVVFGALTESGAVDLETNRRLVEAARPLSVTFHRAFDEPNVEPRSALQALHTLGVDRLLTSGQQPTALQGVQAIADAVSSSESFSIMPGAGLRPENAAEIVRQSKAREIHGTASRYCEQLQRKVTCQATVRAIREQLDAIV